MAVTYVSIDILGLQENMYARTHKFNVFNKEPSTAFLYVWYGPVEVYMRVLSTWHGPVEATRTCMRTWHGPVEVVRTC